MEKTRPLWIRDIFGNAIHVTDIDKAIEQADLCSSSPYPMDKFRFQWVVPIVPFRFKGGGNWIGKPAQQQIVDLTAPTITVGEYYRHALTQLGKLGMKHN
jgi:hypothetical protein